MLWHNNRNYWALGLLLLLPHCVNAELADKDKPLNLEADQVLVDDARKTSTFSGNVQLTQGTMTMRADKIVVVQDKQGFQRGTLHGKPASFRQKREGLDEYIEGYGDKVEYDARADTLNFYGQARIKREFDEIRGEHIHYNARTEIFQVDGRAANDKQPSKRVRAVIQPKAANNSSSQGSPVSLSRSRELAPAE